MRASDPPPPPEPTAPKWDAIRVPRQLGLTAMTILGSRAGAIAEEPQQAVVYYFVPAGTAAHWDTENTAPLHASETVPITPMRRTSGPGPHWRVCPGDDAWTTDPEALAAALEDSAGSRLDEVRAS